MIGQTLRAAPCRSRSGSFQRHPKAWFAGYRDPELPSGLFAGIDAFSSLSIAPRTGHGLRIYAGALSAAAVAALAKRQPGASRPRFDETSGPG